MTHVTAPFRCWLSQLSGYKESQICEISQWPGQCSMGPSSPKSGCRQSTHWSILDRGADILGEWCARYWQSHEVTSHGIIFERKKTSAFMEEMNSACWRLVKCRGTPILTSTLYRKLIQESLWRSSTVACSEQSCCNCWSWLKVPRQGSWWVPAQTAKGCIGEGKLPCVAMTSLQHG